MAFLLNSTEQRDITLRLVRNELGEVCLEIESIKKEIVVGLEHVGCWTKPQDLTVLVLPGQVLKIVGGVARELEPLIETSDEPPRRKIRK